MRFALLGNHPDALEMASALVDSGRHHLAAFTTSVANDIRQHWGPDAKQVADLEEVLADPAIDAVLVGGTLANRVQQLRRALQSERHVLCVHPPDDTPEIAYEAAMIQRDTGYILLPLLPQLTHPAVVRLAQFIQRSEKEQNASFIGLFRLLEMHWTSTEEVLDSVGQEGHKPTFPGWDVLRRLGGEIVEVTAFAEHEELRPGGPVFVSGRFERGGLFQTTLLPLQAEDATRLVVSGTKGRAELLLPQGWDGPALLTWRDETGELHEEAWERWDPWPALVTEFEAAVALARKTAEERAAAPRPLLTWQDTVRAVELDDAARRSVEKRRSSLLEYQEASEEVGFKGTMTLVGCLVVWLLPLVLLATKLIPTIGWVELPRGFWIYIPHVSWLIVPALAVFLGLQLLRYLIPRTSPPKRPPRGK
jgi:predicted dehydrogenase